MVKKIDKKKIADMAAKDKGKQLVIDIDDLKPQTIKIGDFWMLIAIPKNFSTGSKGYYAGGKAVIEGRNCQIGINITIIGSKPLSNLPD